MGVQIKLGMDPASTTPTEEYECTLTGLAANEQLVDAAGLRGTRIHASERVRQGTRAPHFQISLQPNSLELNNLLPRILGGAENLDSFPLAETLPTFVVVMELSADRWQWIGCKVARAVFSSSQGAPLNLELDVEALDVAQVATAFPALSISTAAGPYMHQDLVATISGTTYQFRDTRVTIDNHLKTDRFFNSQTRTALPEMDRTITWELDGPYGDQVALYALSVGGVACIATWTNGTRSLQFNSGNVQFPRIPPTINGRDEIMLPLSGIARGLAGGVELTCTNTHV
jgi:hypothetical protein